MPDETLDELLNAITAMAYAAGRRDALAEAGGSAETDQLRAALRAACQEVERQRRVIHALETAIWRLAEIANADAETGGLPAGNAVIRVAEGKPMPGDIERIALGVGDAG